jgi:hypothetical protein
MQKIGLNIFHNINKTNVFSHNGTGSSCFFPIRQNENFGTNVRTEKQTSTIDALTGHNSYNSSKIFFSTLKAFSTNPYPSSKLETLIMVR